MANRSLFVDETAHPIIRKHGIAILLVHEDSLNSLIAEAMQSVRKFCDENPDTHAATIASKTLDRGYFHAREDGAIAKDALLEEIKTSLHGQCDFFLVDSDQMLEGGRNDEWAWRAISHLVPSVASTYAVPPRVVMAERQRFSDSAAANWNRLVMAELAKRREGPESHPPFHEASGRAIEVASPQMPGLQLVDHLLWRYTRALSKGNVESFLDEVFIRHLQVPIPQLGISSAMATFPLSSSCELCTKSARH